MTILVPLFGEFLERNIKHLALLPFRLFLKPKKKAGEISNF
jgi:hypothetical protein